MSRKTGDNEEAFTTEHIHITNKCKKNCSETVHWDHGDLKQVSFSGKTVKTFEVEKKK